MEELVVIKIVLKDCVVVEDVTVMMMMLKMVLRWW